MSGGFFCVGAISVDGKESYRLLQADGHNQPPDTPFDAGELWDVEGRRRQGCIPPHVEDFLVTKRHLVGREPHLGTFLSDRVRPWRGGPEALFDGAIRFTGSRSGYISRQNPLPGCSTGFWLPDRPLSLVQAGDKAYYHYERGCLILRVSYVGTIPVIDTIPIGTLVRVSLARWWRPEDAPEMEERCYLQLSCWYGDVAQSFAPHARGKKDQRDCFEETIPF